MKNIFRKPVLFIISVLFLSVSVFADGAKVTYVKGKVEVERNGRWIALSVGDTINSSETISTGFNSEAKLEYGGSIMSLGAVTRVTLEDLAQESTTTSVSAYLKTGAVRSKVNHTAGKRVEYTVKSPVAVASVRGTDFTIAANGTISCYEGAVAVFSNKENRKSKSSKKAEESEEDEDSEESSVSTAELSTDYGPATATTPANEISSQADDGAVVVSRNQEVKIKVTGNPETPLVNTQKKVEQQKNLVSTAAQSEAVSVGGSTVNTTSVKVVEVPVTTTSGVTAKVILQD